MGRKTYGGMDRKRDNRRAMGKEQTNNHEMNIVGYTQEEEEE